MKKETDERLLRLLEGLKMAGVQSGSRNKTVAEKTGYADDTVLKALSGNTPSLSSRFCRSVCEGFGISREWVEEGKQPVLLHGHLHAKPKHEEPTTANYDEVVKRVLQEWMITDPVRMAELVSDSDAAAIHQAVKVLRKMRRPLQWRAVGVLEEMLEADTQKQEPS